MDDPYYARERTVGVLLHQTLPNFVVPVILGLAATLFSPFYAVMFGLFLIWRITLGGADWRWPLRALRARVVK
jgi:hypothetical protein